MIVCPIHRHQAQVWATLEQVFQDNWAVECLITMADSMEGTHIMAIPTTIIIMAIPITITAIPITITTDYTDTLTKSKKIGESLAAF